MKSDNPYEAYFVDQAKGRGYSQLRGALPGFQGAQIQRGFGLGSLFRGFYRTALPVVKTGAKLLGITLLDTGANIVKNLRKSVEKREKQGRLELLNKVKKQMSSGQSQKRKRMIKDSEHSQNREGYLTRQRV